MKCPYCDSEISERAIKCPECHSFIIEKRKGLRKRFSEMISRTLPIFLGVTFAIIISMIFFFQLYGLFQVRYDRESRKECFTNQKYLTEVLSYYEMKTGEKVIELSPETFTKLEKVLGEDNFEVPFCPLGGKYKIAGRNRVLCTAHGSLTE